MLNIYGFASYARAILASNASNALRKWYFDESLRMKRLLNDEEMQPG